MPAGQDARGRQRRGAAGHNQHRNVKSGEGNEMSKFRVLTPKGASFTVPGGGYGYEKEALDPIDAARTADAIYAKGLRISKKIIDALQNCKVITLGSVGVDSVDVKAATARGIPVTNIPDTFIEEVA